MKRILVLMTSAVSVLYPILGMTAESDKAQTDIPDSHTIYADTAADEAEENLADNFNLNYFMILYGPSVTNPSAYQPNAQGKPNTDRPVIMKNFLSAGYSVNDKVTVAGT